MRNLSVFAFFLAALLLALPRTAGAEPSDTIRRSIVLRNATDRKISVALGYPGEHYFNVARGWYNVDPGAERTITFSDVYNTVKIGDGEPFLSFYAKSGVRRWQKMPFDLDSSLCGTRCIIAQTEAFVTTEGTDGWNHLTVRGQDVEEGDPSFKTEEIGFRVKEVFGGTLTFTVEGDVNNSDDSVAAANVVESMKKTVALRNTTGKKVSVALAYQMDNSSWAARGWYNVEPEKSRNITLTGVDRRDDAQLFFYAASGKRKWEGDGGSASLSVPISPKKAFLSRWIVKSDILASETPQWIVEINKLWYQYQTEGDFAGKWQRQAEDTGNETEDIKYVSFARFEPGFSDTIIFGDH